MKKMISPISMFLLIIMSITTTTITTSTSWNSVTAYLSYPTTNNIKSTFLSSCSTILMPPFYKGGDDSKSQHARAHTRLQQLTMKVGKGKSKQARSKGSQIALTNDARVRSAGRKGTKKFVDPNKVFVGNLAYDATESDLRYFLIQKAGIAEQNIESIKIIRDWKSGESKGYGFIQFMAPIFATSALELIKGKRLKGRIVRLDQGKKKMEDPIVVVKTKREEPITAEDQIITNALHHVEDDTNLDQDIIAQEQMQVLEEGFYLDQYEASDDSILFDDEEEDDDFQFDGFYNEEFLPDETSSDEKEGTMNREQRRDAAKNKKKRRKPGKGFGNTAPIDSPIDS